MAQSPRAQSPLPETVARMNLPTASQISSPVDVENSDAMEDIIVRPSTPVSKLTILQEHGLPSPQTPSFQQCVGKLGRFKVEDFNAEVTESVAGDANIQESPTALAAQPSPSKDEAISDEELAQQIETLERRRSSRISAQVKPKETADIKVTTPKPKAAPKATPKVHAEPDSPAVEDKILEFEADCIPFEGLPDHLSLEWQLQYPPGGSTHPSYPFPTPDPRLIFHENLVPIVNGLPDCGKVDPLLLPPGWRHVSWFGLLPIVFDAYQQAFKLTPIGPLPLGQEELSQNGLAKYVPGGELHPETDCLPDLVKLSDGSEGHDVMLDWPGISWRLPWAAQGHFDESMESVTSHNVTNSASIHGSNNLKQLKFLWREARDCPNKVFDLQDGWRWIAEKEQHPAEDFVPDTTRRWHGSGALRSTRKFKSPIGELMMLAKLSEEDTENPTLRNQDAREPRKNNNFCAFKSVSTPVYVDITLLADTEFTLMELLCYFPQHFNWGAAAERLHRAGFTPSVIRDTINMTRELSSDFGGLSASTIASATKTAKKRDLDDNNDNDDTKDGESDSTPEEKASVNDTARYTAEDWQYEVWEKLDYPLLALAHGLKELPEGDDAGPLTALIRHCRENAHYQVLLSEVPSLLQELGIEPLIEPGENGCPDQEVLTRHAKALKKDRKRVKEFANLREIQEDEHGITMNKAKKRKMA